ncbi:MAG TPA: hypothetical protein VHE34_24475 [Puia sp.]|uniref:hypothetical protein n=1 Tax=Puia sp. TaxID=2045100 RepID=UPI002C07C3C7|nr:hypothetical protein [Puia sp.]HVU98412.1 hypothetical protein [Puia sp.]
MPLLLCLILCVRQSPTMAQAAADLQRLLEKDESARRAGDSLTRLQVALQLRVLLNDAPDAILATAHAYSMLRDSVKVFETLTEYAQTGAAKKNMEADKKFAWLVNNSRFQQVCRKVEENEKPISRATTILQFPDTGYLAEDIDYDRQGRSFFFTSILQHAVFRLSQKGSCQKFAASSSGWPMMAIKIDQPRDRLWVTEVAMPGFDGQPDTAKGQSAICSFDLHTGKLKERFPAPEGAQWGDMVLDRRGDPILADGQSGAIFRLQQGAWQRLDHGDFISPQTMALSDDGGSLIVPDYVRGLAIMDIASGKVAWIHSNPAQPCALNGIDGVYKNGQRLLMTQNGVEPERIVELQLDKAGRGVTGCTMVEKASPGLGEPTHGVWVGDDFYFIANSGWNVLDRHGKELPGSRMTPPALMLYRPSPSRTPTITLP